MAISKWNTTVWTVYHPPLTCDSHMFIQILPHHGLFTVLICTRDNNPGVSVNEQQCLMSNCKLHAHVIRNTNKRKRGFGKHAQTFFCEWVGVHMNKSAGKLTTHYCMYVWIYCCFQVQWQSQINRSSHVSEEILRKAHSIHVLYGKFTWSWILTSSRWTQWVVLTNVHWNHWRCNNCTAMSGRCLQEFLTCYLNSQSV